VIKLANFELKLAIFVAASFFYQCATCEDLNYGFYIFYFL